MNICFAKITEAENYFSVLPKERQQQLISIKHEMAKRQSIVGEGLVRTMLEKLTGKKKEEIVIIRDGQKKPYLAELPFHFNISHSGEYVMAAISIYPIGIDIEMIGRDIWRVMQRVCRGADFSYIMDGDEAAKMMRMTEIWTRKEALIKCIGTGIIDKRMTSVVKTGETVLWLDGECYCLSSPKAPKGYCCAVCEKMDVKQDIKDITEE